MEKDDGGPAFPADEIIGHCDGEPMTERRSGMSMRDYFAAKAMAALVSGAMADGSFKATPGNHLAVAAYLLADAMIDERAERGAA